MFENNEEVLDQGVVINNNSPEINKQNIKDIYSQYKKEKDLISKRITDLEKCKNTYDNALILALKIMNLILVKEVDDYETFKKAYITANFVVKNYEDLNLDIQRFTDQKKIIVRSCQYLNDQKKKITKK